VARSSAARITTARALRGTQVAAIFYTRCETARLIGVDPQAYLLRAVDVAIAHPGAVTFPDNLIPATTNA
jgi:transposase